MTIERRPFGQSFAFRRGGLLGLGYVPNIAPGPSSVGPDLGINVNDPYYGASSNGAGASDSSNWILIGAVVVFALLMMSGD
jgi:hypothetical protein